MSCTDFFSAKIDKMLFIESLSGCFFNIDLVLLIVALVDRENLSWIILCRCSRIHWFPIYLRFLQSTFKWLNEAKGLIWFFHAPFAWGMQELFKSISNDLIWLCCTRMFTTSISLNEIYFSLSLYTSIKRLIVRNVHFSFNEVRFFAILLNCFLWFRI